MGLTTYLYRSYNPSTKYQPDIAVEKSQPKQYHILPTPTGNPATGKHATGFKDV